MSRDDDEVLFHMGEGCLSHGDEYMRECTMCGMEFCAKCFRGSVVCPDCAEEPDRDDEDLDGALDEADEDEVDDLLVDAEDEDIDMPGDPEDDDRG